LHVSRIGGGGQNDLHRAFLEVGLLGNRIVASSVTLLMSWLASKNGTKATPK